MQATSSLIFLILSCVKWSCLDLITLPLLHISIYNFKTSSLIICKLSCQTLKYNSIFPWVPMTELSYWKIVRLDVSNRLLITHLNTSQLFNEALNDLILKMFSHHSKIDIRKSLKLSLKKIKTFYCKLWNNL